MGIVTPTAPQPNPARTTLLLGVATIVAQSVLLHEAMAAMGGSETAWGLVMALWLTGMGLGSRTGVRFGTQRLATSLPVVVLVLAGIGAVLLRAAPAILGTAPGEALTTWRAVWLWASAVVPAAFAGGLAFPTLAEAFDGSGPGRAYAWEAAGALVGGFAFSFALAPLGAAPTLLITLGGIAGLTLWGSRPFLATGLVLGSVVAAIPSGPLLSEAQWRWAGRPHELGHRAETRHQRLEMTTGPPYSLYADGRLEATYPDPYTTLPRAHLMMLLHPGPRRVLALGCAADGSLEAMLHHSPTELILVEDDPRLLPVLSRWYGPGYRKILTRDEIRIRTGGPLRSVSDEGDLDLVILADGDPATLRANRTRTVEFFQRCRSAMADDGIIIVETGVSDTYLGGNAGRLLAVLSSTLHQVFPQVTAVPGEHVLLMAGGAESQLTTSPGELAARLAQRPDAAEQLPSAMLSILVDESRQPPLDAFLAAQSSPANTIRRPRAVSLAATLHEARSRSRLSRTLTELEARGPMALLGMLGAAVAVLLIVSLTASTPVRAMAAAWAVGFASMGWWLLLLALWQATRGSVYAEVGALTAVFMAGVAGGGWAGRQARRPEQILPLILAAGAGLSVLLATGLPTWAPIWIISAMLMVGGVFTGAAFPALGALADRESSRRGAGIAFFADEIGAATAALIIGTAAIPWVGTTATALGLAVLGTAGIPAVMRW